jgi:hypothetical protein
MIAATVAIYRQAPPLPRRMMDSSGATVMTRHDVGALLMAWDFLAKLRAQRGIQLASSPKGPAPLEQPIPD